MSCSGLPSHWAWVRTGFIGQETLVFPPAIRLLEQGRLNLEPLVTHQIQLKELPAAIEELRAGRATKVEVVGFD